MAGSSAPPLIAPAGVVPPQPQVPEIRFEGIGANAPTLNGNESPDILYDGEVRLAVQQFATSTEVAVAGAQLQERYYRDAVDFYVGVYGAMHSYNASTYSADKQLEAEILRLTTVPTGDLKLQANELANRVEITRLQLAQQKYAADQGFAEGVYGVDRRYAADVLTTTNSLAAAKYGADQELAGKTFVASTSKDTAVITSTNDLTGRKYEADQRLVGDKYGADRQYAAAALHESAETARLTTKLNYADGKFNVVYPFVQQSIQDAHGLASQGSSATPGLKQWADLPFIDASGVLTPAQVQQQVNAAWAKNDSRTQAQILQTQRELTGRGFSSNSPLLEALRVGYVGQNFRANNDAATQIRIEAAKANADAVFAAQKAVADQFNNQQGVVLESEKNQITRQVGLVGALAQLIGGIT